MQKPLKVSHAGTNYYISNIELNISRITGSHATRNQFSGTAYFWVSFDFKVIWGRAEKKIQVKMQGEDQALLGHAALSHKNWTDGTAIFL